MCRCPAEQRPATLHSAGCRIPASSCFKLVDVNRPPVKRGGFRHAGAAEHRPSRPIHMKARHPAEGPAARNGRAAEGLQAGADVKGVLGAEGPGTAARLLKHCSRK